MLQPVIALLLHFALPVQAAPATDPELERLAASLTGSFSSQAQSVADPEFKDVRLEASRIWTRRSDGPWIYVEQAMAGQTDAPYRQRIYHLVRLPDGSFESQVYLLPDPSKWIGEGSRPDAFASITPRDLERRVGCEIAIRHREDGAFAGKTGDHSCASELSGATRATSEVEIWADHLVSWDRGWNALGEQVWGATKAGYRFVRQ